MTRESWKAHRKLEREKSTQPICISFGSWHDYVPLENIASIGSIMVDVEVDEIIVSFEVNLNNGKQIIREKTFEPEYFETRRTQFDVRGWVLGKTFMTHNRYVSRIAYDTEDYFENYKDFPEMVSIYDDYNFIKKSLSNFLRSKMV